MNRKEIAELMSIIQAFLEGKTIERKTRSWELNKGWRDETQWEETEELICRDTFVYRIKPEPKYRPFKSQEECSPEMLKHQPFGWLKDKNDGHLTLITVVDNDNMMALNGRVGWDFLGMMNNYVFADGTPFGVKEEE